MILYPAIDILEGRAVRLLYGRRDKATDYGDPVDCAKRWIDCGAGILHVVDLSGAFGEGGMFAKLLEKIASLGVAVQSGGGLRSEEAVRMRFESGAARVVLGTLCVEQPEAYRSAAERYGKKIVVGIDAKDGVLVTRGWTESTGLDAFSFAREAYSLGVREAVFTDVGRDGALSGVNLGDTLKIRESGLNVIASGGIACLNDLIKLKENGVCGAILGRSIYTGAIDLREAVALFGEQRI